MNSKSRPKQGKKVWCKRCLYSSDHPLGLCFDERGVCSGCRIHEEKETLDWDQRFKKLTEIVSPYRCSSGQTYDCIVPVTGANDSYFIVHVVKNILKLNPLLVSYNKYFNTPTGIKNLANLRVKFNCDILIQNINPQRVKSITRRTLYELGSVYWPCLAGHTVFPVQTSVRYGIPLIIWGANQGIEQVGMFSHEHEVEMTRRYRRDHDLMGVEADDLLTIFDTLSEDDIWQYRYPNDDELFSLGVRGLYLGNYIRWDPRAQHEDMIRRYNYKSARLARTFDTYEHVDCFNYMALHDHLKFIKHGYGRVTDHACREIRHGRLSREKAVEIVKFYESQPVFYIDKFCEWLGVDRKALSFICRQHKRSRSDEDYETPLGREFEDEARVSTDNLASPTLGFVANSDMDEDSEYVTIGRGYP